MTGCTQDFTVRQDILSRNDSWTFLEADSTLAIVSGTSVYNVTSIAGDVRNIVSISSDAKDLTFKPVNASTFHKVAVDPDERTGTPAIYTVWADQIKFWPEPDAALTLNVQYYKKTVDLTSDTTSPEWDVQWDRIWLTGALALGLHYNDDARWDSVNNLYERLLDRMEAGSGVHVEEEIMSSNFNPLSVLDNDDYDPRGVLAGILGP